MDPSRPEPVRRVDERVREWVVWFGPARLLVGGLSVGFVALVLVWLLRPPPAPAEASLPMAAPSVPSSTLAGPDATLGDAATIVVHVAGAVVAPGVTELDDGARVVDAVEAAGGLTADAQADSINLAAPLADGDRVYVPRIGEQVVVVPAPDSSSAGPIDVNTAGVAELDTLPGIGPSLAEAIVEHRSRNGPFVSVDELTDVPGIGPAKLASLRELVTV